MTDLETASADLHGTGFYAEVIEYGADMFREIVDGVFEESCYPHSIRLTAVQDSRASDTPDDYPMIPVTECIQFTIERYDVVEEEYVTVTDSVGAVVVVAEAAFGVKCVADGDEILAEVDDVVVYEHDDGVAQAIELLDSAAT